MTSKKSIFIIGIIILSIHVLILNGCVQRIIGAYGYAARDESIVREDGQHIVISDVTPSISQGYHPTDTQKATMGGATGHHGIDIIGDPGTPVIASASGKVVVTYFDIFYGHRVVIDHGKDQNGHAIRSKYLHLRKRMVDKGDRVDRGQQIGELGRTGLLAGYPHLHYEIRVMDPAAPFGSLSINPHYFWIDGAGIVTCYNSSGLYPDTPLKMTYPLPCRGIPWR